MIFELKEKKDKVVEKMYGQAMKELNDFYQIGWKHNMPKIFILKDRTSIDFYKGYKTEFWMVGWAEGNSIFLLDRKKLKTESTHKYSKEYYFSLIKHELAHLFFRIVANTKNSRQFKWFNEGLAVFLSGQKTGLNSSIEFENFISQYSNWNGKSYKESGFAVEILFKEFGREKMIKFIKSLNKVKSEKDFEKEFKNIYGALPTYDFFNKMLKSKK